MLDPSDFRHPVCHDCRFVLWQNPKPSVEALIVRTRRGTPEILLGRRASQPQVGLWDLPGGFLNSGEMPEAALVRECEREVGVRVRVGELICAVTDKFLDSHIISLCYLCEPEFGDARPVDIIDTVQWFPVARPPDGLAFEGVREALAALQRWLGTAR